MSEEYVSELLARLAKCKSSQEQNEAYFQATRSEILGWLPPEQQARLAELEGDHAAVASNLQSAANDLKEAIESLVIQIGTTVKAHGWMAMFSKGRTSWDSKALDGYALAHPEILAARKVGEPSVTIKPAK